MGFWSKVFGGSSEAPSEKGGVNHQLPSTMVAQEFGEVNVRKVGAEVEILLTIMMEPQGVDSEGWQTGVALDGSGSMQPAFGRGLDPGPKGSPSEHIWKGYIDRGEMQLVQHQGQTFPILSDKCKEDLVHRGHFKWSKNEIEPLARKFTAYLASNLDADGGTTVIYWACGDGTKLEEIGDLTAEACELQQFPGPLKTGFGDGTFLTPAVRYFADKFADAKNGMYVFITDGELNDLEEVKKYTISLCKEISYKRRNPLKCVLIGIGESINEDQMEQLDDLDSGTDVDIWDHKIAKDMRNLVEIFAEVVNENQVIAPSGKIYDATGNVVKHYTDGLPARITFRMPATSDRFELEVGEQRIKQSVVVPKK